MFNEQKLDARWAAPDEPLRLPIPLLWGVPPHVNLVTWPFNAVATAVDVAGGTRQRAAAAAALAVIRPAFWAPAVDRNQLDALAKGRLNRQDLESLRQRSLVGLTI